MAIITIADVIARMGADKASIYADTTEQTTEQVVTLCLESSNIFIEAFYNKHDQTFNQEDKFAKRAITLYAIAEVYAFSNAATTGEDEKNEALEMLENSFKLFKDEEGKPDFIPYVKITQSKGARSLDDIATF